MTTSTVQLSAPTLFDYALDLMTDAYTATRAEQEARPYAAFVNVTSTMELVDGSHVFMAANTYGDTTNFVIEASGQDAFTTPYVTDAIDFLTSIFRTALDTADEILSMTDEAADAFELDTPAETEETYSADVQLSLSIQNDFFAFID